MKQRILYIEPDADYAYPIRHVLEEEGFDVFWIAHPGKLLDSNTPPDAELVIFGADADHSLIRNLLAWKQRWTRQLPLMVISCYCFKYEAESLLGHGVDFVFCKPFEIDVFARFVRYWTKHPDGAETQAFLSMLEGRRARTA